MIKALIRAALPKIDKTGSSEPCGKSNSQVCDYIIRTNTFTIKVCGKVFKIKIGTVKVACVVGIKLFFMD